MKNLIVVGKSKTSADFSNVWRDATENVPNPSGVTEISNGVWLIDASKSFAILAAIVSSAGTRGLDVFAFEVDQKLIAPEGFDQPSL
jgi:hypothetical protein